MTHVRDPEARESQLLHQLVDFSKAHVLEIGCGDGHLTWQYAASAERVVGLDADVGSLREALSNRPDLLEASVAFVAGTGDRLPFPDGTFDIVLFSSSL